MTNTTPCQPIGVSDGQIVSTKKCSKCGEVRPLTEYQKNSGNKDGLFGYCKVCAGKLHRAKYRKQQESKGLAIRPSVRSSNSAPSTPEFSAPADFVGPVVYLPCTTCGEVKSMFHYSRHSASKYKRNPCCLDCNSAKSRGYFSENKEKCSAAAKVYRAEHADELKASKAAYFQENKEAIIEKRRQWALEHPEENHEFWAAFYARHKERLAAEAKVKRQDPRYREMELVRNRRNRYGDPERYREYQAAYHEEHKERIKDVNEVWRESNAEKVQEYQRRRSLYIGDGGFMSWSQFRALVREARRMSVTTGVEFVLDHKYPILGERVSGLNTPANLHIVTREYNQKKGNKMPGFLAHEHFATEPWEVYHG